MKVWLLCVLVSGCASHTVRCDARLQPINAPAPNPAAAPTGAP